MALEALARALEHYKGQAYPDGERLDFPVSGVGQEWINEPPSHVLDIGSQESWVPEILVDAGYTVVAVDWRPLDRARTHSFAFVQGDFNTIQHPRLTPSSFDIAVATSSIEHFGLGYYKEPIDDSGDIKACSRVYELLKPGGIFYLTIPTGVWTQTNHYRKYDKSSLHDRLTSRFEVLKMQGYQSGGTVWKGDPFGPHDAVPMEMVCVLRKPIL